VAATTAATEKKVVRRIFFFLFVEFDLYGGQEQRRTSDLLPGPGHRQADSSMMQHSSDLYLRTRGIPHIDWDGTAYFGRRASLLVTAHGWHHAGRLPFPGLHSC